MQLTIISQVYKSKPEYARHQIRLDNSIATIEAALKEKEIYNVDYKDAKSILNSAFESAVQRYRRKFIDYIHANYPDGYGKWETPEAMAVHDLVSGTYQAAKALRTLKKIKVAKALKEDYDALLQIYSEGVELNETFKKLKKYVVMGRRPETDPDVIAKRRTIENTGTCSCCDMNVKLDDAGKIFWHGYQVKWKQFVGKCHGVHFLPFEISPEGAISYLSMIQNELKQRLIALPKLEVKLPSFYADQGAFDDAKSALWQAEWTIRQLKSDVKHFTNKIQTWKKQPLPDAKLKKKKA